MAVACAQRATLPPREPTPSPIPLPTNGGLNACAGVGFTGSATLVVRDGTTYGRFLSGEKEIFWPAGFVLVSDPPVWRVVAPDGRLFAMEGEDITAFLMSEQWRGWSVCVGGTSVGVYCGGGDDCVRRAGAATPAANPTNEWLSADGMARAAALRTSLGLRADDGWIRFVATDPQALANVWRYSIPMLDTEVAHIDDRETLIAALARFGVSHADAWGSYYSPATSSW